MIKEIAIFNYSKSISVLGQVKLNNMAELANVIRNNGVSTHVLLQTVLVQDKIGKI